MTETTPIQCGEPRSSWRDQLSWLGPLIGLGLVCGFFWLMILLDKMPASFFELNNFQAIARYATILGIAALAVTVVMIAGGIDLSVGAVITLSCVMTAWSLREATPIAAAAVGIGAGLWAGIVNGLLVSRVKIVPFIATLGTMLVVGGVAQQWPNGQPASAPPSWLSTLLMPLPDHWRWMIVPPGVWLLIVLAVLMAAILRHTRFGRHAYAVGSNEQAARVCGVPVARVKLLVFMLAGCLAGIAGVVQFSYLNVSAPPASESLVLAVIAAVLLGGGSLSGGEGSVLGSLIGAVAMAVIANGCAKMGLTNPLQDVVTGAILIAAAAVDQVRHRWQ